MRSKYFLGVLVTGAALAAVSAGCGDDETSTTGGGGDGGTPTTSSTTTSSTTGPGGTGGTGGMGACAGDKDGNCDFDTADTIELTNEGVEGDLEPVDGDEDFYEFDGKEGQALFIYTEAKPQNMPFDPGYADLVITLYDENKQQLAENDDPTPRVSNDSEIYTILPKTGKYFVRVEECNVWAQQNNLPDTSCAPAGDIDTTDYTISILELDPALPSIVIEDKAMDIADAASAVPIEYQPGMAAGTYIISTNAGYFTDAMDKDYYSFALPGDIMLAADERLIGYFNVLPNGTAGTGSTADVGLVSIVNATTMETVAQIDGSTSDDLSPPLDKGQDYLLVVEAKAGGDFATNPFYFTLHYGGGSNPVETEPNDTSLVAGALTQAMGQTSYFIEGNVVVALMDADWFSMTVPAMTNTMSAVCGAQRSGSGLRQFKMGLYKDPMGMPLKSGTETPSMDLILDDTAVTAGDTIYLKVEAATQDANVTSSFYRCGVHFRAM